MRAALSSPHTTAVHDTSPVKKKKKLYWSFKKQGTTESTSAIW